MSAFLPPHHSLKIHDWCLGDTLSGPGSEWWGREGERERERGRGSSMLTHWDWAPPIPPRETDWDSNPILQPNVTSHRHILTHSLTLTHAHTHTKAWHPIWLVISVMYVQRLSDFPLPLPHQMKVCNLAECESVHMCVRLHVCSSESEMMPEGEEMEDYYLVYCIYILSILSFPISVYLFSFCPIFVTVWKIVACFWNFPD